VTQKNDANSDRSEAGKSPRIEISDAEEAEIQRIIASDPDAPEATEEQMAQARPFREVHPEIVAKLRRCRGAPDDQAGAPGDGLAGRSRPTGPDE
jgi:hypothetical protein